MQALWRWTGLAAALALAAGGCNNGGGGDSPPAGVPQVALKVERVFPNLSFSSPVAMLQAPNDATRWFVVEQGGVVRVFDNNNAVTTSSVFVDISSRVTCCGELGLLGMAFHPQFFNNAFPRVYLFYSRNHPTLGLVSHISEFTARADRLSLDPASEKILITIRKPGPLGNQEGNHNGGNLAFGLDGLLYAGIGDGGGGNDQHGTIGNAQTTSTLHGKMLRIDVSGATGTYRIPSSNPFALNTQCSTDDLSLTQPCPEIFALGFRNPFRWSFDRGTTQLWVGDVGQSTLEEVDRVDLGGNYGWRCFEGTVSTSLPCGSMGPRLPPVAQYGRSVGITVIGGYVYRGSRLPGLIGRYIFGDFGTGLIFSIDATAQGPLTMTTGFSSGLSISSFGEGVDGELYVVHYAGQLFRITQ
jgi:glucose/arabinose dehydrogenase